MKKSESKIQQEIYMWFFNNYCLKDCDPKYCIFSVPNEMIGTMSGVLKSEGIRDSLIKRIVSVVFKKFSNTGLLPGVSDLIALLPNKALFIEVKTITGTQSPKQKDFEQIVSNLGFEYHLVRSLEDFQTIIKKHYSIPINHYLE